MAEATAYQNEDEGGKGGKFFSPPLYQQRYNAVLEVARQHKPVKVVDFGCAECKLLRLLKRELYIECLVGVDVDPVPLTMHSAMLQPLITDHLHPRPHPLYMALMEGSIAKPDERLINFDLLTCVEVIEHLESPVLDAVPEAIFGFLRPKMVVMTTPNAEYNVLFPGFTGFRHHDHKFEWTRQQFQTWCEGVCAGYGYTVVYGGVGEPPPDRADLGYCSQMATFTLSGEPAKHCHTQSAVYKVVAEASHPYREDTRTQDEKLMVECKYYLNVLLRCRLEAEECERCDDGVCAVPLHQLLLFPKVKELCREEDALQDIRRVLSSSSIQLDEVGECALLQYSDQGSEREEDEDETPSSYLDTKADIKPPSDTNAAESWDSD